MPRKIEGNHSYEQSKRPKAAKGRVREEMMNLLAQQPYTLTDLSRILKVSKPTINYHLSDFARRGVIEGAGIRVGRGGLTSRLYVMKHGIELLLPASDSDTYYLDLLSGIFESKKLEWTTDDSIPLGRGMTEFLFHTFRLLRNVTKTRHHDILRRYGLRIGKEVVGPKIEGYKLSERLISLKGFWIENEMGNIQILPIGTVKIASKEYLNIETFQCLGCFGTKENGGPLCSLTRGIVDGVLQLTYGTRYDVGERLAEGAKYEVCIYPIKKTRTKLQSNN